MQESHVGKPTGSGTGGKIALWSGSGSSTVLTDSSITEESTQFKLTKDIRILDSIPAITLQDSDSSGSASLGDIQWLDNAASQRAVISLNNAILGITSKHGGLSFATNSTPALTIDGSQDSVFQGTITTGGGSGSGGALTVWGGYAQNISQNSGTVTAWNLTNAATASANSDTTQMQISQKDTSGSVIDLKIGQSADGKAFFGSKTVGIKITNTSGNTEITGSLAIGGNATAIASWVTESQGIASNDNDTTIPTSAAVKNYVDSNITAQDLDFSGTSGTGSVDLDSQTFAVIGTANEIETSAGSQQLQIGLPDDVTIGRDLTVVREIQTFSLDVTAGASIEGLAVTGNSTFAGDVLIQQAASTGLVVERTGATGSFIGLKDSSSSVFIGNINQEFVVQTPGSSYSSKLIISSSGNSTFAGLVSIGNNTATDFLDWQRDLVIGDGTADAGLTIYHGSGGGNGGFIAFADGNTGTDRYKGYITYSGSDDMKFATDTVVALTIDTSQNATFAGALTGTTASFTRLDINASNTKLKGDLLANTDSAYDIGASGANRPRNLYLSNSINAGDITTTGVGTFGGIVTGQSNGNTFGNASASGRALILQSGSANQAIRFQNNLGGDGTLSITGTANTMNYSFNTFNTSNALFIQNDGNVGIGTDSPNLSSNGTYGNKVLTVSGSVAGYAGILELASVGYAGTGGNMGQIQFVNGTSRNASISSHPETSVLDNAFLNFSTKATGGTLTERMRLTSGGFLQVVDGAVTLNKSDGSFITFDYNGSTKGYIGSERQIVTGGSQDNMAFSSLAELSFATGSSLTKRMSITSAGEVLIGTQTVTSVSKLQLTSSNAYYGFVDRAQVSGTGFPAGFFNSAGSLVGTIGTNNTSTTYTTSSDYRLKENVIEMTNALDRVSQLKPSRFNFIADADKTVDGFLAHEVQDIVPEAITGEKDATQDEEYEVSPAVYEDVLHPAIEEELDEDGNIITEAKEEWTENVLKTEAVKDTRQVPDYQGIDQSKLVPLLVGAIQELKAEIDDLKNKCNCK